MLHTVRLTTTTVARFALIIVSELRIRKRWRIVDMKISETLLLVDAVVAALGRTDFLWVLGFVILSCARWQL
jgi:hypothetical protein